MFCKIIMISDSEGMDEKKSKCYTRLNIHISVSWLFSKGMSKMGYLF